MHNYCYKFLDCELDIEPPDAGVGYSGRAFLVSARANGIDVVTVLTENVIDEIERAAFLDYKNT